MKQIMRMILTILYTVVKAQCHVEDFNALEIIYTVKN